MSNSLVTLHVPRPIGLPFRSARSRLSRLPTSADGSSGAAQRAHGSRTSGLRDAGQPAASIGGGCAAQSGPAATRGACHRSASETSTTSGKTCAGSNNPACGKACSNRGAGA